MAHKWIPGIWEQLYICNIKDTRCKKGPKYKGNSFAYNHDAIMLKGLEYLIFSKHEVSNEYITSKKSN